MANEGGRNLINGAGPLEHPPVTAGYVSRSKPAPKAFSDPLWVILPSYSTDSPYRCMQWVAAKGKTLPAQGAAVTVLMDTDEVPTVVWFAGEYA
jgi:hypothetical protein